MDEALNLILSKDTKQRMSGVEHLQSLLEHTRIRLTAPDVARLVDSSLALLKDCNFRVAQGALQALASAAAVSSEHLKLHFNALLPAIVERLGDSKQPVRDAARRLLLALMEISSPTIIVERAGSSAWAHRNWRVREEFARTVACAINLFAATELPFQRLLLPAVLQLLEDSNSSAREAAMACLEEMYRQGGSQLQDELQQHSLRASQLKEISGRFEKIEPKRPTFENVAGRFGIAEVKTASTLSAGSNRRSSPKTKPVVVDMNSIGGDNDITEKAVEPIKVYSEKELTKELDKVSIMLSPEQDWSVRMAAMQRIGGLVYGGAVEYACFPSLVKNLVGPLSQQLGDRRSSIVKQACHLLSLLSKELLGDFEPCAESFIPVLFKLVVITVLVIAESADTCIKTMLRNCRVARTLPRIIDNAKNDRNSVLRARCCEYALLVLEQWSESPEIQRLVELYEDLIKCCVGDAMSEVRSTARMCFRLFAKCWPDRARQLFASFDPVIQRLINEEEGGIYKRYASPSLRDWSGQQLRHSTAISTGVQSASAGSQLVSFGATPIVAMDRTVSLPRIQRPERSLETVLQAQQQVNEIETMLKGIDILETEDSSFSTESNGKNQGGGSYRKIHASVLAARVGIDPPSARDPPHPASTTAISQVGGQNPVMGASPNYLRGVQVGISANRSAGNLASAQDSISSEFVKSALSSGNSGDVTLSILPFHTVRRVSSDRSSQASSNDEGIENISVRQFSRSNSHAERPSTEMVFKGSFHNSMPGFQRPLLRTSGSTRSSVSSRSSMDNAQLPLSEAYSYLDGLMSLNDALMEGLNVNSDWSARVAAFNYLRKLLQQGPRGLQEVGQSFEKVMKLFSQHLDDPHHKVAQAALSTLAELVPACHKSFEAYLERILPHVFSRLVDPKEFIRQLGTAALEVIGNQYSTDSLLPALLRSLDEQRSPKAKIAVIEFAIAAFAKLALNGEAAGGNNLLKMWLAKLAPLANDKNAKLKERAVTGIISVYSHFDSATVLNFILGLSIEEQSTLRRALKQFTPRIEVDLMNFLQSRGQRSRSKSVHEQPDFSSASDDGLGVSFGGTNPFTVKGQTPGGYSSSLNKDGVRKWTVNQADYTQYGSRLTGQTAEEMQRINHQSHESHAIRHESFVSARSIGIRNGIGGSPDGHKSWPDHSSSTVCPSLEARPVNESNSVSAKMDSNIFLSSEIHIPPTLQGKIASDGQSDGDLNVPKVIHPKSSKKSLVRDTVSDVPSLLNELCSGSDEISKNRKRAALHEFIQISKTNQISLWSKYHDQILTGLLEVLDDSEPSIRELVLSTVLQILNNQKGILEESVEKLLEKLLHSAQDLVAKVSSTADRCLTTVLTQYDPYRCLTVIVPLLVSEDEKTLVTCISALTKLVGRLPPEELMSRLSSFLPALFEAFGSQSADVRKTVVFCLVDIYIVLGNDFLPYLGRLSSTQLRLVTIYANRISQARSGTPLSSA